jgi:hypothetical protein
MKILRVYLEELRVDCTASFCHSSVPAKIFVRQPPVRPKRDQMKVMTVTSTVMTIPTFCRTRMKIFL